MKKRRTIHPLAEGSLQDIALAYVARYATSRARLVGYLQRKLNERGWAGKSPPDPEAVADRMVALRYIDDAAYAAMKAGALVRRGYGKRRLANIYYRDGIAEGDRGDADAIARSGQWDAAVAFARKKRIGAFAQSSADPALRQRQLAGFLRAGHDSGLARQLIALEPGADIDALRHDSEYRDGGCDEERDAEGD